MGQNRILVAASAKVIEEENEQLFREQIRGAHVDRARARRKVARKRERKPGLASRAAVATGRDLIAARVVRTEGAFFVVQMEDGQEVRVKSYKGTRTANPNATLVAVGDEVRVGLADTETQDAAYLVEEVLPRRTKLARRAAGRKTAFEQVVVANIDLLLIVASVHEPKLRSGIIDRYIVAGIEGALEIALVINKMDLASPEELDEALYQRDIYRELGYPVFLISAMDGSGALPIKALITGKTSVLAGHSGVGKSSILNALLGSEVAKTGELQRKFRRGAHTTSSSLLLEVPATAGATHATYLVDSPGVREFANFELDPGTLKFAFVEFQKFQEHCAITNCSHIHEPGCAVRLAVEEDKISIDRYSSYEKLFEEARRAEIKRIRNQ